MVKERWQLVLRKWREEGRKGGKWVLFLTLPHLLFNPKTSSEISFLRLFVSRRHSGRKTYTENCFHRLFAI